MRFHPWPLLLIALVFALVAIAGSTSAADILGDWDVASHEVRSGETINVYGNITVRSGGHLDLTNVDLRIDSDFYGTEGLFVDRGGKLTMNGGSVGPLGNPISIGLHDMSTFEGVRVFGIAGWGATLDTSTGMNPPLTGLKGGINVYDDDVYIGNCTIELSDVCGIYAKDSSPTIYGNIIRDISYWRSIYRFNVSNAEYYVSAQAFGILLDTSPAVIENNDIYDIGNWTDLAEAPYGSSGTNLSVYFDLIAAGVAAKASFIEMDSNEVYDVGPITTNPNTYLWGGRNYTQYFTRYMVAGVYGYEAPGSNITHNILRDSGYGIYIDVSTSAAGGAMDFEVIIDNEIHDNLDAGIFFDLAAVSRDCNILIWDNEMDMNGEGTSTGLDDSGLVVSITSCSGDVEVVMKANNVRNNVGRGAHVYVVSHSGTLDVQVTDSNTFTGNGGAGLLVDMNTVSGAVKVLVDNSSFTNNRPATNGDDGAITIRGGSLSGTLDIKMADTTSSANTGSGVMIAMGEGMSVNLATSTKYTIHNCQFGTNTEYGIYLYDNYGANAQKAVYEWKDIHSSNNHQAVYVHSNSALGNIHLKLARLTANDASTTDTAVTFHMAAATYVPKSLITDITINYAGGSAPAATGLALQGTDENKRWIVDIYRADITQPGIALAATFCDVTVHHSTLEGVGETSVTAADAIVDLYYCQVPHLSATTSGIGMNVWVKYYRWFNLTLIAWQNGEPIRNQTIAIKRFLEPYDEIYTAPTDVNGKLPSAMVPYWERDSNNYKLFNDELRAFTTVRGDTLQSLWFDFNDTRVGIDDPDLPELIINSPGENTVQKSGAMVIQGEIRDSHSGIRFVEVTLDNVVWYPVDISPAKYGLNKAVFTHTLDNLTDGLYTISIRGWDVARYPFTNLSFALVTIPGVKIDTQPPALQVDTPPSSYETTNKWTYEISGQTERSVNIRKLMINDTRVDVLGTTFSLEVYLHEGSNFFIIIAEDLAGNIAVTTREIILDTDAPTLIVSSPINGYSSNQNDFEIAGDTEQTATVYVRLDDRSPQLAKESGINPRFYFVLTIKDEGFHTITVTSVDLAGNTFTETIYVKYDITPPVLEDIVPTLDPKPTNQQTIQVSGRTDNDVVQVTINDLKFPVQEGYFAAEINLLEGQQELFIHVMDMARNENFTTRSILIDVTPPLLLDLTVSSTKAGGPSWALTDDLVINERSVRFRGRVAEEDIRDLYIQVEADNRSAIMDDPEALTFYRDFNLDEDDNILSFYAIDIAGNRLQLNYVLNVDPRAPTIEYFFPKLSGAMEVKVDEETVFISGKVTDKGTVTLFINNRQVLVTPTTGAFQTNVPLDEGLNNIPVEVTDKAGNRATDLLHITYEKEGSGTTSVGETLASLWWVFAIVLGLLILIPIVVHTTRERWIKEHPELENWDPQRAKEGLYEYEDEYTYIDDPDQRGGGY